MLVDAGNKADGGQVVGYLKAHGVKQIDILVATHPHEDHIGRMPDVLTAFKVGRVWDSGYSHGSKTQQTFLSLVQRKGLQYGKPRKGFTRDVGPVKVQVLAPSTKLITGTESDANNNSLVLRLEYGKTSVLLSGDMETEERAKCGPWPTTTVLKVAHHGSRNGTDTEFAIAVHPTSTFISYGQGNSYGHPHQEAITVLTAVGAKLYSTAESGTVVITSDGQRVSISTVGKKAFGGQSRSSSHHGGGGPPSSGAAGTGAGTVYITHTGECYHADGCSSLRKSRIPISRSDAITQGYHPCKRCRP